MLCCAVLTAARLMYLFTLFGCSRSSSSISEYIILGILYLHLWRFFERRTLCACILTHAWLCACIFLELLPRLLSSPHASYVRTLYCRCYYYYARPCSALHSTIWIYVWFIAMFFRLVRYICNYDFIALLLVLEPYKFDKRHLQRLRLFLLNT